MAKTGDILATDVELMQRTGWTRARLKKLYRAPNWDWVEIGDMNAFLSACGLVPQKQRRYIWAIKRALASKEGIRGMRHLRTCGLAWRASMVEAFVRMVEKVLYDYYNPERGR